MGLTYLLDEDISHRVAEGLRHRGIDAISVYDLGRTGSAIPDEEQLEVARDQDRVFVTFNRADDQAGVGPCSRTPRAPSAIPTPWPKACNKEWTVPATYICRRSNFVLKESDFSPDGPTYRLV